MKPVTVIISTANRPEFLETALESVLRQTVIDEVEEVIVSENLGNRESEKVCAKFTSLPIRYIFQDTLLEPPLHFDKLIHQVNTDYIALLHDDDWWGAGHLQTALSALRRHTDSPAFFSAAIIMDSEEATVGYSFRHIATWIAANRPKYSVPWIFETTHILAITWVFTPFHMSGMVVRTGALLKACRTISEWHIVYGDRILYAYLSLSGPIIYSPYLEVFMREHAGRCIRSIKKNEGESAYREGSKKIFAFSKESGFDLPSIWECYFLEAPPDQYDYLVDIFNQNIPREDAAKCALDKYVGKKSKRSMKYYFKIIIRGVMPYFIVEFIKLIKKKRRALSLYRAKNRGC